MLIEELKGDEKAQYAYLKASLEEKSDMPEVFLKAVESVAKARGFSGFSKKTGLNRENLYRIFSNERTHRLEIVSAIQFPATDENSTLFSGELENTRKIKWLMSYCWLIHGFKFLPLRQT